MKICIVSQSGSTLCGNNRPGITFVILPHDSKIACRTCLSLHGPVEITGELPSGSEIVMRYPLNRPVLVSQ